MYFRYYVGGYWDGIAWERVGMNTSWLKGCCIGFWAQLKGELEVEVEQKEEKV
jgi:hypothetical protein